MEKQQIIITVTNLYILKGIQNVFQFIQCICLYMLERTFLHCGAMPV